MVGELPVLYRRLLSDPAVVVHQVALETFSQFAEETPHETVVPATIQPTPRLQEAVVAYLNHVSTAYFNHVSTAYFNHVSLTATIQQIPRLQERVMAYLNHGKLDKNHIRGLRISFKIQGKIEENDLFTLANISNLDNRRKVHLRNFMYRNKKKCIVKENNIIITRGNSGPTFKVTKPNCETFKRNVYYNGAIEWNSLDADVRKLEYLYQFKRIQKSWLIKTYTD